MVPGIAMARRYSVDVLVLDFSMPGMDGNEVAQVLMKERPNLPVVVHSGFPDDIPESLKWFADSVLGKGSDPELLLLTIEKLIDATTTTKKPPARTTLDRQDWLRIRGEAS
jgi:DNA-binding NarL/FixJ family response regulator